MIYSSAAILSPVIVLEVQRVIRRCISLFTRMKAATREFLDIENYIFDINKIITVKSRFILSELKRDIHDTRVYQSKILEMCTSS